MDKKLQIDDFTNIPQALNVALEREKGAYAFYVQGAQCVENVGVKTLFKELAAEEKNHITRIQAMIDTEIMQDM